MKIRLTKKLPHYPKFAVGSVHEVLGKRPLKPKVAVGSCSSFTENSDGEVVNIPLGHCEIDENRNTLNEVQEFFDLSAVSNVDHPSHYNAGKIECIDAIKESMSPEQYKGFLKGQVVKYLWRYEHKGKPTEDLKKAEWYLERLEQFVANEIARGLTERRESH